MKRLEKHSEDATDGSGCRLWTGTSVGRGYGTTWDGERKYRAHRLAYELHNTAIPAGLIVRHRCDNPRCINPDHLELGTSADNMQDMMDRGRSLRGETNPHSKIDPATAYYIHREVAAGRSRSELGRELGLAATTVAQIAKGRRWPHIYNEMQTTCTTRAPLISTPRSQTPEEPMPTTYPTQIEHDMATSGDSLDVAEAVMNDAIGDMLFHGLSGATMRWIAATIYLGAALRDGMKPMDTALNIGDFVADNFPLAHTMKEDV